jgi:hypothetical protein
MFVLDEADEMLSRGFKDQIYEVFKSLPNDVQVKKIKITKFPYTDIMIEQRWFSSRLPCPAKCWK